MASGGVHTVRDSARVSGGDGRGGQRWWRRRGGGEHAREDTEERSTRQKTVRVYAILTPIASVTWVLALLTFASSDFIVSLSYSTASKMVRTRVTFENPPADLLPASRALRARALRRRRAELRRCEIFAWPLARTDERPAAVTTVGRRGGHCQQARTHTRAT